MVFAQEALRSHPFTLRLHGWRPGSGDRNEAAVDVGHHRCAGKPKLCDGPTLHRRVEEGCGRRPMEDVAASRCCLPAAAAPRARCRARRRAVRGGRNSSAAAAGTEYPAGRGTVPAQGELSAAMRGAPGYRWSNLGGRSRCSWSRVAALGRTVCSPRFRLEQLSIFWWSG